MFFMFVVNLASNKFYLYYSLWYFDIFMHFLGGAWVGLFFVYVLGRQNQALPSAPRILLYVLVVGLLWEFFELFSHNYIGRDSFDILDTFSDVIFDLAGGAFAVFFCFNKLRLKEKIE